MDLNLLEFGLVVRALLVLRVPESRQTSNTNSHVIEELVTLAAISLVCSADVLPWMRLLIRVLVFTLYWCLPLPAFLGIHRNFAHMSHCL